jgi:signal transduction histidine kinase
MQLDLDEKNSTKSAGFGIHSIGSRLFLSVMAAAAIGLGGLGTLFYQELRAAKLLQLTSETDIKVRELEAEIQASESFLKSLVAATNFLYDSGSRSPLSYNNLITNFFAARPRLITGFGVMQTPNSLVDRQWFAPYIEESRVDRGIKMAQNNAFALVDLWKVDKYPQLQYYKNAVEAKSYFWSEPYINESYPVPLMTFAGPVFDRQGNLIAVMNGDINIRDLKQVKENSVRNLSGYYVLATSQGSLLSYSPDPSKASKLENISSIPALKSVWNEVQAQLQQGKSQGFLGSNDTQSYWVYQKVPSNKWVMLQAVPFAQIVSPALLGAIGATLLAGIFLAIAVLLFVRHLNRRLQPILNVCNETLTPANSPIESKDEISSLSNSFFGMVERQNALLQQLQLAHDKLLQSHHFKDSFLATMSHELRTPLSVILGMSEGLQDKIFGSINDQQLKALQTIERSGEHLLELINDILDVAKIESGQIELNCSATNLADLCQASLMFVSRQALAKGITTEAKIPNGLPDLFVEERRIRQVLINLLNNAVKFTPENGHIILEVSHLPSSSGPDPNSPSQEWLQIAVIDTGIGISPEDASRLFQPFIQIDSALNRKYQGTGLGLALVKKIVELHGGQVHLNSKVGVGSRFAIDLPCVAPANNLDPGNIS